MLDSGENYDFFTYVLVYILKLCSSFQVVLND